MPFDLLFLDIDGVLNDHARYPNGYCGIKRECADLFNIVLDKLPKLEIVISSAWRYLLINQNMTIIGFEQMLLTHGLNIFGRIYGYTDPDVFEIKPKTPEEWSAVGLKCRKEQILKYSSERLCNNWLAVDDLELGLGHRQIKTDPTIGITLEQVNKIVEYFNGT